MFDQIISKSNIKKNKNYKYSMHSPGLKTNYCHQKNRTIKNQMGGHVKRG